MSDHNGSPRASSFESSQSSPTPASPTQETDLPKRLSALEKIMGKVATFLDRMDPQNRNSMEQQGTPAANNANPVPTIPRTPVVTNPPILPTADTAHSPTTLEPQFPPLAITKHKWPSYNGKVGDFGKWKVSFMAVISASELSGLYNPIKKDLVDSCPPQYDLQLYSRIISCLPEDDIFKEAQEYIGSGIALWRALLSDREPVDSAMAGTTLLAEFHSSIQRTPTESIEEYWIRFNKLVQRINKINSTPIDKTTVRIRFLTTLGDGFAFIIEKLQREDLDPWYITSSDSELKSYLKRVQSNQVNPNPVSPGTSTIGSMGYSVHAAVSSTQSDKVSILESQNKSIQADVKAQGFQLEIITNSLATMSKQLDNRQRSKLKYCHSCGENNTHRSDRCTKTKEGHRTDATWTNRMGGSTDTIRKE
jgi:hypothetical protein